MRTVTHGKLDDAKAKCFPGSMWPSPMVNATISSRRPWDGQSEVFPATSTFQSFAPSEMDGRQVTRLPRARGPHSNSLTCQIASRLPLRAYKTASDHRQATVPNVWINDQVLRSPCASAPRVCWQQRPFDSSSWKCDHAADAESNVRSSS